MPTIREEIYPVYKIKKQIGTYGVEIETETLSKNKYPEGFITEDHDYPPNHKKFLKCKKLPGWDIHLDGSLRNYGIEYVFSEPYTLQESMAALDLFEKETSKIPFIQNSPSTSVHVHVNISNETFVTMGNFLTLWILFENVLVEFSGESRRSNLFALPNRCAERTHINIIKMFQKLEKNKSPAGLSFPQEVVKYAAINLGKLSKFGSLEIRCFRGSTKVPEIKQWLRILDKLLTFSRTEGLSPREMITFYRRKGVEFFDDVFGEESSAIKACVPDVEAYIERNLWYAAMISDCVKNWWRLNTILSENKSKSRNKKIASWDQLKMMGMPNHIVNVYIEQGFTPQEAYEKYIEAGYSLNDGTEEIQETQGITFSTGGDFVHPNLGTFLDEDTEPEAFFE